MATLCREKLKHLHPNWLSAGFHLHWIDAARHAVPLPQRDGVKIVSNHDAYCEKFKKWYTLNWKIRHLASLLRRCDVSENVWPGAFCGRTVNPVAKLDIDPVGQAVALVRGWSAVGLRLNIKREGAARATSELIGFVPFRSDSVTSRTFWRNGLKSSGKWPWTGTRRLIIRLGLPRLFQSIYFIYFCCCCWYF